MRLHAILDTRNVQKLEVNTDGHDFRGKIRSAERVGWQKYIFFNIRQKQGIQRQSPNLNNGPIEKFAKGRVE